MSLTFRNTFHNINNNRKSNISISRSHSPANTFPVTIISQPLFNIKSYNTNNNNYVFPVSVRTRVRRIECVARSTEESEPRGSDERIDGGDEDEISVPGGGGGGGLNRSGSTDSLSLGIREPVYEVVEVKSDGKISTKKINRRHLLKSSGEFLLQKPF